MSWTYSGDPNASQRDEVRFHLQDVDETFPLVSDEEIDFLLARYLQVSQSVLYVAHLAAMTVSRKFAGVVSISADGVSVNVADLSTRYQQIAEQLYAQYNETAQGEVDTLNLMIDNAPDPSIRPLSFGVGMHDNPAAGGQGVPGGWYDTADRL